MMAAAFVEAFFPKMYFYVYGYADEALNRGVVV